MLIIVPLSGSYDSKNGNHLAFKILSIPLRVKNDLVIDSSIFAIKNIHV